MTYDNATLVDRKCATCTHWKPLRIASNAGNCVRHAPSPVLIDPSLLVRSIAQPAAVWPATEASQVCGEWAGRLEMPTD